MLSSRNHAGWFHNITTTRTERGFSSIMPKHQYANILIIEDDAGIAEMLRFFFSSRGMRAAVAGNGNHGFEMIASFQPDIIILDVILPYMDGLTLLEKLRRSNNTIPVIMLTEKNQVEEKLKGLELGADDYVTKPFSLRELHARVQAVLQRTINTQSVDKPRAITVAPLTIDPLAREVSLADGSRLTLTKTEFNILYFLAEHINQVVPHQIILEKILGYDPNAQTKALVMHIANIRKKLKSHGIASLQLQSVSGIGYKLTENISPLKT